MEEILKIENVYKYYGTQKLLTKAVDFVIISIINQH